MKILVYTNESGGVSVCVPADVSLIDQIQVTLPNAVVINAEDLPDANDFFNAWELDGSTVTVNIAKARDITKDRLRVERSPLLDKLDVDFQRALEADSDTTAIINEKNRLRDITLAVDTVSTLEELRAIACTLESATFSGQ